MSKRWMIRVFVVSSIGTIIASSGFDPSSHAQPDLREIRRVPLRKIPTTPQFVEGEVLVQYNEDVIRAKSLNFSSLSTSGHERGGAITINADHLVLDESGIQALTNLTPGGAVTITGKVIELTNGSSIASSTRGDGDAAPITITATDHLGLLQAAPFGNPSGIISNSIGEFGPLGKAGDILITTPRLEMTGGARINTTTATSGRGGNVTINTTDSVSISGEIGGQTIDEIFTHGSLHPSGIFTETIGGQCSGPCGNAGNVSVTTGTLTMGSGAQINSGTSSSGQGGNITVTAADMVHLTNSQINASVEGAQTTISGNIVIDPQFVVLQNSQILAQATQGQGGNITITTPVFLTDVNSIVDASSQSGVNGTVNVQSPISQAGGKIVPLSKTTLDTTALLGQRCAAMVAGGQFSSFVVAGRDALPTEPGGWLMSPLALETAAAGPAASSEGDPLTPTLLQGAKEQIVSVRRLPQASAALQIFPVDWAGCGS